MGVFFGFFYKRGGLFCERVETRSSGGIFQDLGVTILSVILRRIILGKNCTALPLEVGARPSHVDHGGSVLNCYQFELARLIVLNLKICLNIGFFTPLKLWQPRGDANMRRRIWKTFPIFLFCLTKWTFKLQLLPVERRFVHMTFFGILLTLARSRHFSALWPFIPTR